MHLRMISILYIYILYISLLNELVAHFSKKADFPRSELTWEKVKNDCQHDLSVLTKFQKIQDFNSRGITGAHFRRSG